MPAEDPVRTWLLARLADEAGSLCAFLRIAGTWVPPDHPDVFDLLRSIGADDARHADELAAAIGEVWSPPRRPAVPDYTHLHFAGTAFLLPLCRGQKRRHAEAWAGPADLSDHPALAELAVRIAAEEAAHLARLDAAADRIAAVAKPAPDDI